MGHLHIQKDKLNFVGYGRDSMKLGRGEEVWVDLRAVRKEWEMKILKKHCKDFSENYLKIY